jgi:hypothetical protein
MFYEMMDKDRWMEEAHEDCASEEECHALSNGACDAAVGMGIEDCEYTVPSLIASWKWGWRIHNGSECTECGEWVPFGWMHGCL